VVAGWLQAAVVIVAIIALHVPLGDYMARTFSSGRHWRAEMVLYRCCGIDPDADQRWPDYLRSLLAVSLVGILVLYLLLRAQALLPYSLGHPGMNPVLAFNTAVSFTTNTSWQNYSGEATLGYLAQAASLGTEAFLSAAVGLAAALALIRGLIRRETDRVGNFWVDLIRSIVRLLLPLALVSGLALAGLGVIQNLGDWHVVTTLAGGRQGIPGGPVASWEPIKLMSGDGGGFFNANSAHPFENPTPLTNVIEIVLMLLVPVACIRMFGRMVGQVRQGWALLAVAGLLLAGWTAITSAAESHPADPAPRGGLRLHQRSEQQRKRIRRTARQHHFLQRRPGRRHAARPVPADSVRPRAGRQPCAAEASRRHRGHAAHPRPDVRRPDPRHRPGARVPHLPARPVTWPARRRPALAKNRTGPASSLILGRIRGAGPGRHNAGGATDGSVSEPGRRCYRGRAGRAARGRSGSAPVPRELVEH
jgi:hypothetical protein